MKSEKYVILCLLAFMGIVLTGCQNNEPQLRKMTIDLEVRQKDWTFDKEANMFFCHFDVPELTNTIYNYGEVSLNREYNTGSKNAYQVALPETTYKSEQLTDSVGNPVDEYAYYQQHVDYAYGIGYVEVFVTISDFIYGDYQPEDMLFRLQMTY